jgi:mRNA-degrading endonuclease RelE of RelBE toxin-antitoxin system
MARVVLTPEAARQFDELPGTIQQRVARILERLRNWPEVSGAKSLSGNLAGRYRIRTGDYRVQFYVRPPLPAPDVEQTVIVEKIGHRDGFYGD